MGINIMRQNSGSTLITRAQSKSEIVRSGLKNDAGLKEEGVRPALKLKRQGSEPRGFKIRNLEPEEAMEPIVNDALMWPQGLLTGPLTLLAKRFRHANLLEGYQPDTRAHVIILHFGENIKQHYSKQSWWKGKWDAVVHDFLSARSKAVFLCNKAKEHTPSKAITVPTLRKAYKTFKAEVEQGGHEIEAYLTDLTD